MVCFLNLENEWMGRFFFYLNILESNVQIEVIGFNLRQLYVYLVLFKVMVCVVIEIYYFRIIVFIFGNGKQVVVGKVQMNILYMKRLSYVLWQVIENG